MAAGARPSSSSPCQASRSACSLFSCRTTGSNSGAGQAQSHGSLFGNLKALLSVPTLRWMYLGLGMYAVLQISVGTWFPSLLMRAYSIKEDKAADS